MPSFQGIELGVRALRAFQVGLEVTGHNVANVNTPGFSRRRVHFANTPEYAFSTHIRVGTGVIAQHVQRIRDLMLEQRINTNTGEFARLDTLHQQLRTIESVLLEPGEQGISARLNALFNAFDELATRPDSMAARQSVVQAASALVGAIRNVYENWQNLYSQIEQRMQQTIREANDLAVQLARLNEQIRAAHSNGAEAGDLLDQRDRLLTRLSELVGARAHYANDGSVMVFVDGHTLVQDGASFALPSAIDLPNRALDSTPVDIRIQRGQLRGLMDAASNLQVYRDRLNIFASTLIAEVNAIHQTGFGLDNNTGYQFFAGTDASNIALHPDISDPRRIAASGLADTPGNNSVALALVNLRRQPLAALGGMTLPQFYANLVGQVGNDAKVSKNRTQAQELTLEHLRQIRESVSGVSLDEEAANLVKFQRSYQAAAKIVSIFDGLIQDVLQMAR
ncbi:MAG: flagellar hook-associated protein FlgK [Armatimonadota bacterium]|nr:flagellar hook-associated protein FlgK [Armatimonadota bacterium]